MRLKATPLNVLNAKEETNMLLEIHNLFKDYSAGFLGNRKIQAVNDVSFSIERGEIFGLIGESGCGKSTLTKMILGLIKPTSGNILYNDKDISSLNQKRWIPLRKEIQAVFQHPQMTFNPKRNLYYSCAEPLRIFNISNKANEEYMVREMTECIGISFDQLKKFPHEISGGQAQRISIARALSLRPSLLICDEPTSMLDVSVQAQVLRLLMQANKEQNIAMLFISHDLEVVRSVCSRVAVMKAGKIVEIGNVSDVFENPKSAYTKKLLNARIEI